MQATVQTARTMLLHFSMNLNFDCGSRLLLGVDCSTCFTSDGCYCICCSSSCSMVDLTIIFTLVTLLKYFKFVVDMDVVKPFFPGFTHAMFEGAFSFRCDNTYRRWHPVVAKFNPLSYLRADVTSRKPIYSCYKLLVG